jgi:hypothetical protein
MTFRYCFTNQTKRNCVGHQRVFIQRMKKCARLFQNAQQLWGDGLV